MKYIISLALLTLTLSSCLYKMPTENTISLVPNTNNNRYIHDDSSNAMPSMPSLNY